MRRHTKWIVGTVVGAVLVIGCNLDLYPSEPDPCIHECSAAEATEETLGSRCDGNTLVQTWRPSCGPGCDTDQQKQTDCGDLACFSPNGVSGSCRTPNCATNADCPANQLCQNRVCGALDCTFGAVCPVGSTCTPVDSSGSRVVDSAPNDAGADANSPDASTPDASTPDANATDGTGNTGPLVVDHVCFQDGF